MFSQRRSHYWSQQSRTNGTTCCIVALLHNSVCCCFALLRFITTWRLKFIAAFFFFKGFSAKQQKKPKKKEIITALQSECIMRQLYGKYYKMFASKNDLSKWQARWEFDRSSPRSGWTLSVDWLLFWALHILDWVKNLQQSLKWS